MAQRSAVLVDEVPLEYLDEEMALGVYDHDVTEDDPAPDLEKTHINSKHRIMGGNKDKITIALMKARMSALWRHGISYLDICDTVNKEFNLHAINKAIQPSTVGYHIKNMLEYWREKSLAHVDEKVAMTLMRYDQIEQLATEGYFASLQGKNVRVTEKQIMRAKSAQRDKDNGDVVIDTRVKKQEALFDTNMVLDNLENVAEKIKEYERVETNHVGDVKLLALMVDINYKRSQLWGLINRTDVASSDQELARLSDEDRTQRIASVIAQAKSRATNDNGNLAKGSPLGGFEEGKEPTEEQRGTAPQVTPKPAPNKPMVFEDVLPEDQVTIKEATAPVVPTQEDIWDDEDWS